ncbi:MAG: GNAT family N-acetyltransferase [Saprospiraceae bacterium]|nr:GNAT family N-acetyltransferase [Saprospiraceae bacterium]
MTKSRSEKIVLKSKRLFLREVSLKDIDFLAKLHRDRLVMQHIGPLRTRKQVIDRITHIIEAYRNNPDLGIWMCCLTANDQPIGWACLKDLDGSKQIEIGYRLASEFWGHGYATEISKGLLQFGFQLHELDEIVGVTRLDNEASKRVLEKCGLTYQHLAIYYNTEVLYYKITSRQWQDLQCNAEIN